ncbi:MAG: hypothetical protein R3E13_09825 [Alphaproteobacteria bacterium]
MTPKKAYLIISVFIFLYLGLRLFATFFHSDTGGITVLPDHSGLSCDAGLAQADIPNIDSFYQEYRGKKPFTLQQQICIFDTVFDGSVRDRIHLTGFSEQILERRPVGRRDIAQYFYRKAIAAAPDDSLSQYIKSEKLEN